VQPGNPEERIMRSAVIRSVPIGAVLVLLIAHQVAAFEMNGGCTLQIVSTDASGEVVDTVSGPGAEGGGTQSDPFLVDWDGSVSWEGRSNDQVFTNHTWQTYLFHVPTPIRGGDPNEEDETVGTGTAGVAENAPFRLSGLYFVSGNIDGEGGTHCDGSGWFQVTGSPVATIPFWLAVLIALAGAALIASSRPETGGTVIVQRTVQ
jgi:hypothetical protein